MARAVRRKLAVAPVRCKSTRPIFPGTARVSAPIRTLRRRNPRRISQDDLVLDDITFMLVSFIFRKSDAIMFSHFFVLAHYFVSTFPEVDYGCRSTQFESHAIE